MEQKYTLPAQYAAFGIRLTLGITLLLFGLGKIMGGIGNFADSITVMFAHITVIAWFAWPLALFLVFAELIIGGALVLGVAVSAALFLSMLLIAFVNAGLLLAGKAGDAKLNAVFIGLAALGLLAQSVGMRMSMPRQEPEYVVIEEPKKKTGTRKRAKKKTA